MIKNLKSLIKNPNLDNNSNLIGKNPIVLWKKLLKKSKKT